MQKLFISTPLSCHSSHRCLRRGLQRSFESITATRTRTPQRLATYSASAENPEPHQSQNALPTNFAASPVNQDYWDEGEYDWQAEELDEADEQVVEELLMKAERGELQAPQPQEEVDEYEDDEQFEAELARSGILLELLRASPEAAAQKVLELGDAVDELLLEMLEGRLQTAVEMEEEYRVVEHMAGVYRLLRRQYERYHSSPALRLLDDLLATMQGLQAEGAERGTPQWDELRQEAAARMREAFTGTAPGVDIFAAAEALAQGQGVDPGQWQVEPVVASDFIAEAMDVLRMSAESQQETSAEIDQYTAELAQLRQQSPEALQRPTIRNVMQQVDGARQMFVQRQQTIACLEELVEIARAVGLGRNL